MAKRLLGLAFSPLGSKLKSGTNKERRLCLFHGWYLSWEKYSRIKI